MSDKLQEIKDYCKHYDYLDFVNLNDLNWLIKQAEKVGRLEETNRSLRKMIELGLTFEDVYNADDEINPHWR